MRIFILGSGNWGTTLALILSQKRDVTLWTIDEEEAKVIEDKRENIYSLPGVKLPRNIKVEKKYTTKIKSNDILVVAVPSRKIEEIAQELRREKLTDCVLVNVSKGVKHTTLRTIKETFESYLPNIRFANLSGPTIAKELAEGLPAKAVLAAADVGLLFELQEAFDNDLLKFEFSRDVEGIELAASLKGLIAIAVGLADGFGYKTNVFGLVMTYGLNEFNTIMEFLGVNTKTVYGIAGMGDLITTCLSENSRNRRFGKYLALGYSLEEALNEVGMVVEGVSMAKTIRKLTKFNLSIPLIDTISRIIFDDIDDIKTELMSTLNSISN